MQRSLTQGPITRNMLLFALPLMCGNLLQQHENHLPYKAIADEDNGQTVLIVSHGMAIRRFFDGHRR